MIARRAPAYCPGPWRRSSENPGVKSRRCAGWIAYAQHDAGMVRLRGDLVLAVLKNDPRFTVVVQKLGLPN